MSKVDTITLSRRLEIAAARSREFSEGSFEQASRRRSPFDGLFPGKSLWMELVELGDDPLRVPLLAWTEELLVRRLLLPEELELKRLRDASFHPVEALGRELTLRQLSFLLLGHGGRRHDEILELRLALGKSCGALVLAMLEKEEEVFRRLGQGERRPLFPLYSAAPLHEFAARHLEATRRSRRFGRKLSEWNEVRVGRDASAGWPARLGPETLLSMTNFREEAAKLRLGRWRPLERLAPSSFLLGLRRLGLELERARTPRSLPWVRARDPLHLSGEQAGFFLALWPLQPKFLSKRLGLSADEAQRQRHQLLRCWGAECDRLALGALISRARSRKERESLVSEFTGETFERERSLEEWLGLFVQPQRSEGELLALLLAAHELTLTIELWDEDFFENPRFLSHYAEKLGAVSSEGIAEEALLRGAQVLIKWFEEASE